MTSMVLDCRKVVAVVYIAGAMTLGAQADPPRPARVGSLIKGLVVDEQGHPVAGARVSSMSVVPRPPATSRADGSFILDRNEPWTVNRSFLATADGGARQGILGLDGPSGYRGPRTLVRIVLRPAKDVTVAVVDGRGAPVPDAAVVALDRLDSVAEARTDARGTAVLRVPAEANMQWIIAYKPGLGFDYFENDRSGSLSPWSRPPARARLVLDGARTVRVRLVDSAGRPAPGVEVVTTMIRKKGKLGTIHFGVPSTNVRTDADGVATFGWLPAGLQDFVSFQSGSHAYFLPDSPTLVADKPEAELKARVLRSTRVSGKVTMPEGSPAPGILVEARGWGGTRSPAPHAARTRTAEDGSYSMELPSDHSYMIGVTDEEWAARSQGRVIVREGVARTGIDLTLERGSVIRGRVTFDSDSKPAPGRSVKVVEQGAGIPPGLLSDRFAGLEEDLVRYAETDEAGRYALRVGPGTYTISGPNGPGRQGVPERLTILVGRDVERDFTVPAEERPWKTVRGIVRVRTAEGTPLAGARLVVAAAEGNGPDAHGDTDKQGRFEVPCPAGKAIVYARNPEGSLAGYTVADDKDDRDLTIVAGPATTARGRVVDENGKPFVSINVNYYVEVGRASICQMVLTDDDGRFIAPGLPARTRCNFYAYHLGAQHQPSRRMEVKDVRPFEVPPLVIDRPVPLPASPDTP